MFQRNVFEAQAIGFRNRGGILFNLAFESINLRLQTLDFRFHLFVFRAHLLSRTGSKILLKAFDLVGFTVEFAEDFGRVFAAKLLLQLVERPNQPGLGAQGISQAVVFRF